MVHALRQGSVLARTMTYKDRHINRKRIKGVGPAPGDSLDEDILLSKEKQRARELRRSPWWKKKIAPGKCHYCGGDFAPSELTMDHKIPLARGGRSEKINLVPACKACNNKKMYMLPWEWSEYMEKIKEPE